MARLSFSPIPILRFSALGSLSESFPSSLQRLSMDSHLDRGLQGCMGARLWLVRSPRSAGSLACSSLHVGSAGNDAVCTVLGLAGAYSWVRLFDYLGQKEVLEQKLSRKLIHVTTGIIFVLLWPFFSGSPWSRFFAVAIPMANAVRLVVNGFGLSKDEGFVKSISREGTSGELLRGPFYYALVLSCCTLCFWRDSPVGMTAIAVMCGGDGIADIVGRRMGGVKLPYNTRKSWAGSISMFIFGFALSAFFVSYFSTLGYYAVEWKSALLNLMLISLAATFVESLPISAFLDDNISVPLVAVIMGMNMFLNST